MRPRSCALPTSGPQRNSSAVIKQMPPLDLASRFVRNMMLSLILRPEASLLGSVQFLYVQPFYQPHTGNQMEYF